MNELESIQSILLFDLVLAIYKFDFVRNEKIGSYKMSEENVSEACDLSDFKAKIFKM
jgi:hypothetical protein